MVAPSIANVYDKSMNTKTALVSGGAMGYKDGGPSIGGAIALRLAKDGFQVVIIDTLEMGQRNSRTRTSQGMQDTKHR